MEVRTRRLAAGVPIARTRGSFTLAVSGIDALAARLQALGIDTSQRSSGPKVKTLTIVDIDGNHVAFAEAVGPSMAR